MRERVTNMQHCVVKDKKLSIICSGAVVKLTIVPMTFMKLIDINTCLEGDKDLSAVMNAPTPLDLSIVTYCLLDQGSREKLEALALKLNDIPEDADAAQKLFYMMCENNLTDGMQNYNKVLEVIVAQVQESTAAPETKKKTLGNLLSFLWRKFSIRLPRITRTPTTSF